LRSRSISMPERTRSCPVVVVPSRVAMSDIVSKCCPCRGSAAMKKSRFAAVFFVARCDVVTACRGNFGRRETFNTCYGTVVPLGFLSIGLGFKPDSIRNTVLSTQRCSLNSSISVSFGLKISSAPSSSDLNSSRR
jgi:hypothetical protein